MSKEIVVRYACNICGAEGYEPADFASFQISTAEGTKHESLPKPLGFEACRDCIEAEPLSTLLKVGYPLGKSVPKAAKATKEVAESLGSSGSTDEDTSRLNCKYCERTFEQPQGRAAHERWHDPVKAASARKSLKAAQKARLAASK